MADKPDLAAEYRVGFITGFYSRQILASGQPLVPLDKNAEPEFMRGYAQGFLDPKPLPTVKRGSA